MVNNPPAVPALDLQEPLGSGTVRRWEPTRTARSTRRAPSRHSPYPLNSGSRRATATSAVTPSSSEAELPELDSLAPSLRLPTFSLSSSSAPVPSSAVVESYYSPTPSTSVSSATRISPYRSIQLGPVLPEAITELCAFCDQAITRGDEIVTLNNCHRQHVFHRRCVVSDWSNTYSPYLVYQCPTCRWLDEKIVELNNARPVPKFSPYFLRRRANGCLVLYSYAVAMASVHSEDRRCCICLSDSDKEDLVVPQCGHLVHEGCLRAFHTTRRVQSCPACRVDVKQIVFDIKDEDNFVIQNYEKWFTREYPHTLKFW